MDNVMVDLETVGTKAGCGILSIGAVSFAPYAPPPHDTGERFYTVVDLASCEELGLNTEQGTLDWWEKQSAEARKVLELARGSADALALAEALERFNDYLSQFGPDVKVWGNGSDFDNAILAVCYDVAGVKPAWKFWNNRCYRTLKSFLPDLKLERTGTHHDALDDAVSQAYHANQLLRRLTTVQPLPL